MASRRAQLAELAAQLENPKLWDKPTQAQELNRQVKRLREAINPWDQLAGRTEDLQVLIELGEESQDREVGAEIQAEFTAITSALEQLELTATMSGEHDADNAFLTVHSGAGGVDAADWTQMLARMYTRFCERRGWELQTIDFQPGEEAGLRSATFLIQGPYAYGQLKAEHGIHRLVRISPFDSNARRHTSFASVTVTPEVDDTIDVDINEKDLRVDTYRSSGAGGQHVNKTDSAVRLTHLPTNIVVACQNERSQHKNKALAMKILRSRLYDHLQAEHEAKVAALTGFKADVAWGHQLRSYVFQPYTMVKDHRTEEETSDVQSVMDGDIDRFIQAWLRWRLTSRPRLDPGGPQC